MTMKKLILLTLLALPLALMATTKGDNTKYLKGAVPEDENGLVVFSQKFAVGGKSQTEIYEGLRSWAANIAANAIQDMRTRLLEENAQTGLITYRIEEWMVFRKLFLNFDRTRFRYNLVVQCSDSIAEIKIQQISYYYREDLQGENGEVYKAEEWISDKAALNKKGTKIFAYSGKFRKKTIDRAEELFSSARAVFEEQQIEEVRQSATKVLK